MTDSHAVRIYHHVISCALAWCAACGLARLRPAAEFSACGRDNAVGLILILDRGQFFLFCFVSSVTDSN